MEITKLETWITETKSLDVNIKILTSNDGIQLIAEDREGNITGSFIFNETSGKGDFNSHIPKTSFKKVLGILTKNKSEIINEDIIIEEVITEVKKEKVVDTIDEITNKLIDGINKERQYKAVLNSSTYSPSTKLKTQTIFSVKNLKGTNLCSIRTFKNESLLSVSDITNGTNGNALENVSKKVTNNKIESVKDINDCLEEIKLAWVKEAETNKSVEQIVKLKLDSNGLSESNKQIAVLNIIANIKEMEKKSADDLKTLANSDLTKKQIELIKKQMDKLKILVNSEVNIINEDREYEFVTYNNKTYKRNMFGSWSCQGIDIDNATLVRILDKLVDEEYEEKYK